LAITAWVYGTMEKFSILKEFFTVKKFIATTLETNQNLQTQPTPSLRMFHPRLGAKSWNDE
jgi:hypothetical protein